MARQRRRRHDNRWSVWTFVAPIALVVIAVIVITVVRDAIDETRSQSAVRAATTATGTTTAAAPKPAGKRPRVYSVKAGDTLSDIAQRFGMTIEQIEKLNPTLVPDALQRGQRIRLA